MCKSIYAATVRIFMPSSRQAAFYSRRLPALFVFQMYPFGQFDAAHLA